MTPSHEPDLVVVVRRGEGGSMLIGGGTALAVAINGRRALAEIRFSPLRQNRSLFQQDDFWRLKSRGLDGRLIGRGHSVLRQQAIVGREKVTRSDQSRVIFTTTLAATSGADRIAVKVGRPAFPIVGGVSRVLPLIAPAN